MGSQLLGFEMTGRQLPGAAVFLALGGLMLTHPDKA